MLALFSTAIFLSAALVFLVQPMVGKLVLPLLGGTPAVWNTCMVFFQAALLAGYAYAHALTRVRSTSLQAAIHGAVLLTPLIVLPIAIPAGVEPPAEGSPVLWLLAMLAVAAGLPFLVVSTTGPLLQRWFSATSHRQAADPYFLYAASNAGSLLGLLAYPVLVEPTLSVEGQTRAWQLAYGVLVALTIAAGVIAARASRGARAVAAEKAPKQPEMPGAAGGGRWLRLRWLVLACIPSSLLLGVTQYLSTDVAAVPMLWVVPLAIYLVTFIIAFAGRVLLPIPILARLVPIAALALAVTFLLEAKRPPIVPVALHLAAFFLAAQLCHSSLAALRPPAARLTEFYLFVSLGGCLGGIFNALVAPVIFPSLIEYPIAIAAACLAPLLVGAAGVRAGTDAPAARLGDLVAPVAVGGLVLGSGAVLAAMNAGGGIVPIVSVGVPTLACYFFARRPMAFALGVLVLMLAAQLDPGSRGRVLHMERGLLAKTIYTDRTFFGVHRVTANTDGTFHAISHGTTIHGLQARDPKQSLVPLTYYHPTGPIGEVFRVLRDDPRLGRAALVGLGAGSLAAYGQEGQRWTYYEIDPAVIRIAQNPALFTFLRDTPAQIDFVVGDARLTLARAEPGTFGLIAIDAFSSDAIPVHLITREAIDMYFQALAPGGVLAIHVSNRYLDLAPVLAAAAHDLGLVGLIGAEDAVTEEMRAQGKFESTWIVLARSREDLAKIAGSSMFVPLPKPPAGFRTWTDAYSNVFGVFSWR